MDKYEKQHSEFDDASAVDIKKAAVSLLDAVGFFAYSIIKYLGKKWIYILLGVILGLALGYKKYNSHQKMLQTAEFSVNNEMEYSILLAPQFNSIDYLDQLVQTKFRDKLSYTDIQMAKLEGLDDLFEFIAQDSLHGKTLQSLSSNVSSISELVKSYPVSKNYVYQLLTIKATQPFEIETFIADLQAHFNQQPYFAMRKQIALKEQAADQVRIEEELALVTLEVKKALEKGINTSQEVLDKRKTLIEERAQLAIKQLEGNQVVFVQGYIEKPSELLGENTSIEKQIVKDIVKWVLLFLLIGMFVDFVRYYKRRG
ncbi:hypothetical protein [Myroides odoratus]|uniref:hypothetical protein n=1 Tax=Myroides odoratus TaxID=256 RepID=UPI000765DFEF|nr:hypothetical protein [Myroides odoratus]